MVNVDAALSRLGLTRLRLGSFGSARDVLPPGGVDLLAESAQAAESAAEASAPVEAYDMRPMGQPRVTDGWPEPYGVDPVVFGPGPS